jgi:hypothetical protein
MTARFCIAVPAGPGGLLETLRLIRLRTNPAVQAVFLRDGPAPAQ